MKARLPQGYGGGGAANLQQIARQAQKLQEEMDAVSTELETTEYSATAGGDAVKAIVTGKMEIKSLEIKPEVVDPEDVEMLSDLVIAAVNEALRAFRQVGAHGEDLRRLEYAGPVLRWLLIQCLLWPIWWMSSSVCPGLAIKARSGWLTMCSV